MITFDFCFEKISIKASGGSASQITVMVEWLAGHGPKMKWIPARARLSDKND